MLMMLGGLHLMLKLGGLGVEIQGKHQLMLMMLGRLGLKARASTTDAHDACGKPGQAPADAHDARGFGCGNGQAPADAHDARGFGCGRPGQHQLMLMMLGGLGVEGPGKHHNARGCGCGKPGPAPADAHEHQPVLAGLCNPRHHEHQLVLARGFQTPDY